MTIHEIELPDHVIRFLIGLIDAKEKELRDVEPIGNMLPLMAAHDSINAFWEALPDEYQRCEYCLGRGIYIGKDVVTGQEVEIACQYCNETGKPPAK